MDTTDKRLIFKDETWWSLDVESALGVLDSSKNGLSIKQAEDRLQLYGRNIPNKKKKRGALALLGAQIFSPFVLLLGFAAVFSYFLDKHTEAIFVTVAIIVNIALGFWQEYKAGNAINKLENLIVERVRVKRAGEIQYLDARDITYGDILILRGGDAVPADARIVQTKELDVNESILTGESMPASKKSAAVDEKTLLPDRSCMLFAGTHIEAGECEAVVVGVGTDTELGKIAAFIATEDKKDQPLELAMKRFTRILMVFLVFLAVSIFVLGTIRGESTVSMIFLSIAVIVSAVPESLPVALSVVLSRAAADIAKKGSVIRKMSATQTLGSVTTILTDKTGTLTEGVLRLNEIIPHANISIDDVVMSAALNSQAKLLHKDGQYTAEDGTSLERAVLLEGVVKHGLLEEYRMYSRVASLPFHSAHKFSGVIVKRGKDFFTYVLGAPDVLLRHSSLKDIDKAKILAHVEALAYEGNRIVATMSAKIPESYNEKDFVLESIFTSITWDFTGLLNFKDPLKAGVVEAVSGLNRSNIKTILCTGDHPGTAIAIAIDAGIVESGYSKVVTGMDIADMSEKEFAKAVSETRVFARVTPEHKLRIVKKLQELGEIVAVTGDGLNDAPALKVADIGCAMGSGSDVSRDAADMVIVDNNYATIAGAVLSGRVVLTKIRSVIAYLMADVFDELFLIGGALIMSLAMPINALQILFVKFFSDIFPALAFTFAKYEQSAFYGKPRDANAIFDKSVKMFTLGRGVVSSLLLLVTYIALTHSGYDPEKVRTFIYMSFATYLLFISFSMSNIDDYLVNIKIGQNLYLLFGVAIGAFMIVLSVYNPFMQRMLGTVSLEYGWIIGVVFIGLVNVAIVESMKYFMSKD